MLAADPGDCYRWAYRAVFEIPSATLVQGYPRLTARVGDKPEGTRYGHAWIERPSLLSDFEDPSIAEVLQRVFPVVCVDPYHPEDPVPLTVYYDAGRISEEHVHRYLPSEVCKHALKTEHYGPWADPPD